MKHNEFFKALKNGERSSVYFFVGEEQYVLKSALKQLENTVVSPDLRDVNLTVLSGNATGAEICSACVLANKIAVAGFSVRCGGVIRPFYRLPAIYAYSL